MGYARLSGLRYRKLTAPRGAATRWERARFPRGVHFVAEFAAGHISSATAHPPRPSPPAVTPAAGRPTHHTAPRASPPPLPATAPFPRADPAIGEPAAAGSTGPWRIASRPTIEVPTAIMRSR